MVPVSVEASSPLNPVWRKSMLPLPLTVLGMVTLLHALACPLKTETKDSTLHSQRQCFSELAT